MPRPDWDDDRLDDLSDKVDRIEARVDALGHRMEDRFDSQQREINARFDSQQREVNARLDAQRREMVTQFDAMNTRFDSFQRAMFHAAVALSASILTAGAAIVATQL